MTGTMRASRVMKARRRSFCPLCGGMVRTGQQIGKTPADWCHTACIIDRAVTLTQRTAP